MARIFLLKFEVDGARYKCSREDGINVDIQFGVNMEWIQLTQDGLQATPVVSTGKKNEFLVWRRVFTFDAPLSSFEGLWCVNLNFDSINFLKITSYIKESANEGVLIGTPP